MPEFHDALPTDYLEPGWTMTVEVDGRPVAIANVLGEYFAFHNECPHQSTPLGGLPLARNCLLTCPEHHTTFDVRTGKCVVPSQDGWTGDMLTYPTRIVGEVVQVEV